MGTQNIKLKRSNTKNIRDKKNNENNNNMKFKKSISSMINFNSDIFIQKLENDPFFEYSKEKLIGKGTFGEVYLVKHNITGAIRAIKVIDKNNEEEELTDEEILNEINILKKIDHPNIVKLFEFYSNKSTYYLILEFCEGGNLYEFVDENKLSEFQVIYIMFQILSAMNYCHNMNILHGDLKPDNILIKKSECGLCRVKICDFGTSHIFKKGEKQKEAVGTLNYMAPEVLKEKYNQKCDLWSCGVTMYILLTGKKPFLGRDDIEVMSKILSNSYDKNLINKYNRYTKDLLSKLLEINPKKRLSAEQALNHKVFDINKTKEILNDIPDEKIILKLINNLKTYKSDSILKETALAYLVHNFHDIEDIDNACKLFDKLDVDGNGKITKDELFKGLSSLIKSENLKSDIKQIFLNLDIDNNKYISYEEFIRGAVDKKIFMNDKLLKYAFQYFDKDNSGEITLDELSSIFKDHIKNKDCKSELINILKEVDINNDKVIDFEEFTKLMVNLLS
jgi:calcium-dependent protein kinase